jgi:hypothetical protein
LTNPFNLGDITTPMYPKDARLLLHPNIPRGAAGMNPRTAFGKEWWDSTRRTSERGNNYCCYACSVHKSDTHETWLEGHEMYEIDYDQHLMIYIRTVSLCHNCHAFIHSGLTLSRLVSGEVSRPRYVEIATRGVALLSGQGLLPMKHQVLHMYQGALWMDSGQHRNGLMETINTLPTDLLAEVSRLLVTPEPITSATEGSDEPWKLVVGSRQFTRQEIFDAVLGRADEEVSN